MDFDKMDIVYYKLYILGPTFWCSNTQKRQISIDLWRDGAILFIPARESLPVKSHWEPTLHA